MARFMIGLVVLGSCVGCTPYPRLPKEPQPAPPLPAFARGNVRELALSPHLGNRGIGERLSHEVREWRDREVSAIKVTNAQFSGAVLAWVAINWDEAAGPRAGAFDDGLILLGGCLESLDNWMAPAITVSADAEARHVFARAQFVSWRQLPPRIPTYSRAVRTPSGIPLLFVHVTAVPLDHERIGQRGLALYLQRTNGAPSSPAMVRSLLEE